MHQAILILLIIKHFNEALQYYQHNNKNLKRVNNDIKTTINSFSGHFYNHHQKQMLLE